MIFDILQVGDPVLRQAARPFTAAEVATPFVQELISSMRQTMHAASGVGLAAPQVGEGLQVVVMEDAGDALEAMSAARREELGRDALPFTVVINPVVEPVGGETTEVFEGCLSLTGYVALVRRWSAVRVHGNGRDRSARGAGARGMAGADRPARSRPPGRNPLCRPDGSPFLDHHREPRPLLEGAPGGRGPRRSGARRRSPTMSG